MIPKLSVFTKKYLSYPTFQLFKTSIFGFVAPFLRNPILIVPEKPPVLDSFVILIKTIEFALPEDSYINLAVYDIMGRLVKTLVDKKINAGYYIVDWDGTDQDSLHVAASLYIYVLKNNKVTITKKMIMMK